MQQSSESLAGRIAYTELPPLLLEETGATTADTLWLRGGFPSSFTASNDAASLEGSKDLKPERKMVIYPDAESYPLGQDVECVPLLEAVKALRGLS